MYSATYSKIFSMVYEELTAGVDYEKWVDEVLALAAGEGFAGTRVLDLACGVGRASLLMAARGLDVTGLDISENVLELGRQKASGQGLPIRFAQGDMADFVLDEQFPLITCFNGGVNYLESAEKIESLARCVKNTLEPGGVFVFDIMGKGYITAPEKSASFLEISRGYIGTFLTRRGEKLEMVHKIFLAGDGVYKLFDYTVSSRVLAVGDGGVATIEEKWVRQDDGQVPQEFNLNEIYPLIGETIVFRADPSGKVLEVTGISGDGQINEVEVAQWKASRYRLPGKPVAVGAGWSQREAMPLRDGVKTTIRTESRLKNILTEGAEKVAEIQICQEIPIEQETSQQGMKVTGRPPGPRAG